MVELGNGIPFRSQVKAMIEGLAREHQREPGETGTLGELEKLTCQIGDMVTRELTQREVTRRADALDVEEALCPGCGNLCPRGEPEPVVLDGLRGELAYNQVRQTLHVDGPTSAAAAPHL
jgi:hypothetical protein